MKSTYDENLYTTRLDKTKYSSADVQRVEKLAKEIEVRRGGEGKETKGQREVSGGRMRTAR